MKDIKQDPLEVLVNNQVDNQEQTEMALKTALPPSIIDNFPPKPEVDEFADDESEENFQLHLSSDEDDIKVLSGESSATTKNEKKNGETEEDILNKFEILDKSDEVNVKEEKLMGIGDDDKTTILENGVTETSKADLSENCEKADDAKVDSDNCKELNQDSECDGASDGNKNDENTKIDVDDKVENVNTTDSVPVNSDDAPTETDNATEADNTTEADDTTEADNLAKVDNASEADNSAKADNETEADSAEPVEDIIKITRVESEDPENNEEEQTSQPEDVNCEDNNENISEDSVQNDVQIESTDNVSDKENEMNTEYLQETLCNEDNSDNAMDVDNADKEAEKANILKDGMDTEDLLKVTDVVKSIDEVEEKIDESSNSCSSSVDDKDDAAATADDIVCDNDVEEEDNDIVENDLTNIEENDITENDLEENDITENEIENDVAESEVENIAEKDNALADNDSNEIGKEVSDVNHTAEVDSEDCNKAESLNKVAEGDKNEEDKMVVDDDVLLGESDSVVNKDTLSVPSDEVKDTDKITDTKMDCDKDNKDVGEDAFVKADIGDQAIENKSVGGECNTLIAVDDNKEESESKSIEENASFKCDADNESTKSNKRSHDELEAEVEANVKKVKLSEESKEKEEEKTVSASEKIKHLKNLSEFMRSKDVFTLSREDLEEYCMQKICECLVYKSDLGEMQHKIKQYELMIEHWRKEFTRMSKQTKDLEIVHKKLLHELKQKHEKEKAVLPVKITRSVGLQVKLDSFSAANAKRKIVTKENVAPTASSTTQPQNGVKRIAQPASNRSPQVKIAPKSTTLLGQALQKDSNVPTAIRTNGNQSNSPAKAADKGVIDLTDEDDKKIVTKSAVNSPKVPAPKSASTAKTNTAAQQNIRFVTSTIKGTTQQSSQSVTNGPRLMYLVQTTDSQIQRGGVMLKIQSPNGVIGPAIQSTPNSTSTVVVSQPVTSVRNGTVRLTNPSTNTAIRSTPPKQNPAKHPAPLPSPPASQVSSRKPILPKPHLSIRKSGQGIVLSWKMPYNLEHYESIASYQLYAYQETNSQPSSEMWRKVGDIKALALPMACTLTQFADGNKYYFSVRAVDVLKRIGNFSDPEHIML